MSGELSLTQAFGKLDDGSASTRGLSMPDLAPALQVRKQLFLPNLSQRL